MKITVLTALTAADGARPTGRTAGGTAGSREGGGGPARSERSEPAGRAGRAARAAPHDGAAYDPVADQVATALRGNGHRASVFAAPADVRLLVAGLRRRRPDLVFNVLESFGGGEDATGGEIAVAGVLDLLRLPYTGSGPGELFLRQDKGLAKKIFAFEGLHYPDFAVFTRDADLETAGKLHTPLFVKPLTADASIGIDGDSLVHDTRAMLQRVAAIHEDLGDSALVEEYVEGREFYVGVLGNREPEALPPIEMDFSGLPDGAPRILGAAAKWSPGSAEFRGTRATIPDLPDELRARLQHTAVDAYRALRVRDYGRVDLRLTETGDIYVIEVNANCYLDRGGELAAAAAAAGLDYPRLIQRIVELASERQSAASPAAPAFRSPARSSSASRSRTAVSEPAEPGEPGATAATAGTAGAASR
jgi:D-alanine-D-alanine ligase